MTYRRLWLQEWKEYLVSEATCSSTGTADPAALSALVRYVVGPVIKNVIGPIVTQLDEVLRPLDDIGPDASAYAPSSVTDVVGKAVKEASVPIKDKIDIVLNKLSDVGV